MAIREGRWDCVYCGRVGNRGPDKHCMGCGAPRDKDVKLYVPPDAAEVTDQKALEAAKKGPDWHCSFCGGDNPAEAKFCPNCGGGADGTEPKRKVQVVPEGGAQPAPKPVAAPAAAKGRGKWWLWLLPVLALIGGALWFFVFRTHEETLKVTGRTWERTIAVEKFKTVEEERWEDQVPAGARVLSRHEEVHHKDKIQVGTQKIKTGSRDLGNGYFEDVFEDRPIYEEKPVYKDKVRYLIDRWVVDRTLKESGKDLQPRWPAVQLVGQEREGARAETYQIFFVSKDGEKREWDTKVQKDWEFYQDGQSYKASVRASGGIADLEKPAEKP
jgi:predicted nucleic acid-binding Zn ribbon protein